MGVGNPSCADISGRGKRRHQPRSVRRPYGPSVVVHSFRTITASGVLLRCSLGGTVCMKKHCEQYIRHRPASAILSFSFSDVSCMHSSSCFTTLF